MPTEKPTSDTAEAAAKQPATPGAVDIEAFARNLARMIEEGGKALAAYMKPREEGKIKSNPGAGMGDVVKTLQSIKKGIALLDERRTDEQQPDEIPPDDGYDTAGELDDDAEEDASLPVRR